MPNTVEFTTEVQRNLRNLSDNQARFQDALGTVAQMELSKVKPGDFLVALQMAAVCAQALEQVGQSFHFEEQKNKSQEKTLQNHIIQCINQNKSNALSKASSVISDVSGFQAVAVLVGVAISSVIKRSPESVIGGGGNSPSSGMNYQTALASTRQSSREFQKDTLSTYKVFAGVGAGVAAVLAWITGVSFGPGLLIGGLVAAGVFIVYASKRSGVAKTIRNLMIAAEAEFANIRSERAASDDKAKQEHANLLRQESERFQAVKDEFDKKVDSIEDTLKENLTKFQNLCDGWREINSILLDRASNAHIQANTGDARKQPSTRYVQLGVAGCDPDIRASGRKPGPSRAQTDTSLDSDDAGMCMVFVTDPGDNKIHVIKELTGLTGFSLDEARDFVENPTTGLRGLTKERANEVAAALQAAGARTTIEPDGTSANLVEGEVYRGGLPI